MRLVQRPHKLPLVELVVSGDKGARGDDLVAHLLQGVEHVERGDGKLDAPVLLVPPLGRGGGFLGEDPELVQWQAIHSAAEKIMSHEKKGKKNYGSEKRCHIYSERFIFHCELHFSFRMERNVFLIHLLFLFF